MVIADSERELLDRLRAGDEDAFTGLVDRYHRQLIRLAGTFVTRQEVAEDVAQETWLALLNGIDTFEGRSSLRTWLFQICSNRARTIGKREHRTIPVEHIEPVVDAEQLSPSGAWTSSSTAGFETVAGGTDADAVLVARIRRGIEDLPPMQQLVVTMRDVEGMTTGQVERALTISEANQRVLLHRARAHIRQKIGAERARP